MVPTETGGGTRGQSHVPRGQTNLDEHEQSRLVASRGGARLATVAESSPLASQGHAGEAFEELRQRKMRVGDTRAAEVRTYEVRKNDK